MTTSMLWVRGTQFAQLHIPTLYIQSIVGVAQFPFSWIVRTNIVNYKHINKHTAIAHD